MAEKTIKSKIAGIGSYLPQRRLTNADLERMVDTSDEWIYTRTGIKERRIGNERDTVSLMASEASLKAMEMAGTKPEEIDLILLATVTPDYRLPSAACMVQNRLGLFNAAAIDIAAACAGFLHGLSMADAFVKEGKFKKVLVIGVEKLSAIVDWTDRRSCVLFGDGAGAAVVEPTEENRGILSTFLKSDGRYWELLWIPDGGSVRPPQIFKNGDGDYFLNMNGTEIFKHAVREMQDASLAVLKEAGVSPQEIKFMVPHQANIRIIESTAKRLGLSMDKVYLNIEKYGNTSAASVPIALDEAIRSGAVRENDIILMSAFGGGLTWAAALIRW